MKVLSDLLKLSFYSAMALLFVGFLHRYLNLYCCNFSRIGILLLLCIPLALVFFLGVFFAYKKEFKKSFVALILLAVLIGNIFL